MDEYNLYFGVNRNMRERQPGNFPPPYRVKILNSISGEKITTLDMGLDYHDDYYVTLEMVGYELEQWGHQTHQDKSKGYLEKGFSFLRNSNTDVAILPPETKLRHLGEGRYITLKVIIKWTNTVSLAKCLHDEQRYQAAITAVNESDELKELARQNIATPSLSHVGIDYLCKICNAITHKRSTCCNCGDFFCHSRHCRFNICPGDTSCLRCLSTVIKVVSNYFARNNIAGWVVGDDNNPAADQPLQL